MNNDDLDIAQSIGCGFGIIQSPDPVHLRIKITPTLPDSHLDDFMLSLKLYPNLPTEKAKQLEDLLNECVKALWVNRRKLEPEA